VLSCITPASGNSKMAETEKKVARYYELIEGGTLDVASRLRESNAAKGAVKGLPAALHRASRTDAGELPRR
jgi:hypothetical protein